MYLLGHIGVTIFFLFLLQKIVDSDYSKFYLPIGLGSMLPDLIDKPIGSIIFGTGRWVGHSIIFLTAMFILFSSILKEQRFRDILISDIVKVFFVGSIAHLLEDGRGLPLSVVFWPFNGEIPTGSRGDFLHGFEDMFTIFFEILGLILLTIIGISEKWEHKQWKLLIALIISYLSTFGIAYLILI